MKILPIQHLLHLPRLIAVFKQHKDIPVLKRPLVRAWHAS